LAGATQGESPADRDRPLSSVLSNDEFDGQVCIVTGGARGIGAGIAEALGRRGGVVVVADRDEAAARGRAELLTESGRRAFAWGVDVTDGDALHAMVEEVESRLGPPRVLVNNAGLFTLAPSHLLSEDEWRLQVDVLLTGTFLATRAVVPGMLERGQGAIVNISSIGGLGGHPGRSAYNAAKAGVVVLTEVLGAEWATRGVRVNAVAPGVTRTEMTDEVLRSPAGRARLATYERRTPLGRIADVGEIAECVAFLASSRASFITGATLPVDGGWLAGVGIYDEDGAELEEPE
jgi:NAD(P)-dependent dehydrogenase (short-subunit alcohol dehydrogenase family)